MNMLYVKENDRITCYHVISDHVDKIKGIIKPNINEKDIDFQEYIEIGPYEHMYTSWGSNVAGILKKINIDIKRIEKSRLIPKTIFDGEIDHMIEKIFDNRPNYGIEIKESDILYNDSYLVTDIKEENSKHKLGFDAQDIEYYENLFKKIGRDPTNIELFDLAQSNSEHSRHWFFNGDMYLDNEKLEKSLFQMIKDTQNHTSDRSKSAFCDNASAIEGYNIMELIPDIYNHIFERKLKPVNITLTAETHNFPTGVCPFEGAGTGSGGRIRDTQAIGKGGSYIAGTAGYCVGSLDDSKFISRNKFILKEASNGASDYGNKFGEPVIVGFCRASGYNLPNNERREWIKPIMFSGGLGKVYESNTKKDNVCEGDLIVKIGGKAYRIGFGGGCASSRDHDVSNKQSDLDAVQRSDPQVECNVGKLIRACCELDHNNPIISIHDQGAGGTANVTKEIMYPQGGEVFLDRIILGDKKMTCMEVWISEFQEQYTIVVDHNNIETLTDMAKRENVPLAVIGKIDSSEKIVLRRSEKEDPLMDIKLDSILDAPKKKYTIHKPTNKESWVNYNPFNYNSDLSDNISMVLGMPSVGSKRFLTNKVDRSVTGLVAQQQCVGRLHTPLSNYGVVALSHYTTSGSVTSIGEQPSIGLYDPEAMAGMAISEMLSNMMFAKISKFEDIRCSGNWMWPLGTKGEGYNLRKACEKMCNVMTEIGIALDGGKDSLSMTYKKGDDVIKCPGQLVISGYAPMDNINIKVTPEFKNTYNDSRIIFIDLAFGNNSLAGSVLFEKHNSFENTDPPALHSPLYLKEIFNIIQELLTKGVILAGHDRSDGGLITTITEMAIAGNKGFDIDILDLLTNNATQSDNPVYNVLFSQESGIVIEVRNEHVPLIMEKIPNRCYNIGFVKDTNDATIRYIDVIYNNKITNMRLDWEKTSIDMEYMQANKDCVDQECEYLSLFDEINRLEYSINPLCKVETKVNRGKYSIAIIRDEGSNGEREMAAAFEMAGFSVFDVCMNDLISKEVTLDSFNGIAFVGGFTYSDALGAGVGWYNVISKNKYIKDEFTKFYNRDDTFSLGICNGCQLMALLGWIDGEKIQHNISERFESRFSTVKINKTNSIMMKDMENSVLGIWVAHGEGRFDKKINPDNVVIQYVDNDNTPTEKYPYNPNGSIDGIGGVVSDNGRHLAMMPHPERCILQWQQPYKQNCIEEFDKKYSPWFVMFQNAYKWLEETKK